MKRALLFAMILVGCRKTTVPTSSKDAGVPTAALEVALPEAVCVRPMTTVDPPTTPIRLFADDGSVSFGEIRKPGNAAIFGGLFVDAGRGPSLLVETTIPAGESPRLGLRITTPEMKIDALASDVSFHFAEPHWLTIAAVATRSTRVFVARASADGLEVDVATDPAVTFGAPGRLKVKCNELTLAVPESAPWHVIELPWKPDELGVLPTNEVIPVSGRIGDPPDLSLRLDVGQTLVHVAEEKAGHVRIGWNGPVFFVHGWVPQRFVSKPSTTRTKGEEGAMGARPEKRKRMARVQCPGPIPLEVDGAKGRVHVGAIAANAPIEVLAWEGEDASILLANENIHVERTKWWAKKRDVELCAPMPEGKAPPNPFGP